MSLIFSKIIGGLSSFLIAKTLQPANYGLLTTMTLVASYCAILSFGTVEALVKQFPYYKGKGEPDMASRLESTVLASVVITSICVLVLGCALTLLVGSSQTVLHTMTIMMLVLAASISSPSSFYYYRFLAHQDFKTAGILDALRSFLNLTLVVSFSYLWGLTGATTGFCLTELTLFVISFIVSSRSHGSVMPLFDYRAIWNTIVIGFPITVFWWIFMIQASVDRLVSISVLGKTPTGYYVLGISIVSIVMLFPQSISRVLYPKINEKLGATSQETDLFRIVMVPTRFMNLVFSGVVGVLVIFMPIAYHLLPKYLPGLVSGQILLLMCIFRLSLTNAINFLIANNRQYLICFFVIASLCVGFIASYGAARLGLGIDGLAASTCISGLLLSFLIWQVVFKSMGFLPLGQLIEIGKLHAPCIVMLLAVGTVMLISPQSQAESCLVLIGRAAIFILLFCGGLFILPLTRQWVVEILGILRGTPVTPAGQALAIH